MGGIWQQEQWKQRNKWISFFKQYYLQGCCTLSPCLVQISWEAQADWLRAMQEDTSTRPLPWCNFPDNYFTVGFTTWDLSIPIFLFHPAWSVGLLSQDARLALQWFCYWSILCSVLQLGCPLDDSSLLFSTFSKQPQLVLSCYLVKINGLGNGILPVQLTV